METKDNKPLDPKSQQIVELLSKVSMLEMLSVNSLVGANHKAVTSEERELLNYLAAYNKLRVNPEGIVESTGR